MSEILSNRDLIMKNIQNELRNVIIDKYISMIMKLNKEKEILKEKYEKIEKLTNKVLKKLMLQDDKNQKKIYQDLNSSNDIITNCNSTRFITALDRTIESDIDYSKILINNFSPKESKIEYKKISFKKPELKYGSEKTLKSRNYFPKNNKQLFSKSNINSSVKLECKKRKNLSNMNDYVISSYDNDKKLKSKGSIVKFNLNTENNNNTTKGNLIEPLIRKERSSSVKKINSNDTIIITNSFEYKGKKTKKYFENNTKVLNASSSKNYLNNSSIIGKKIRHIKTMSDNIGSEFIQNPSKIFKKNLTKKNGKYLNLESLVFSKSPQNKRNHLIDYKNTSVVKISLASEKINENDN
jgi:hypothetical protein